MCIQASEVSVTSLITAFATVFAAEIGDKTQLAVLALALRGNHLKVFTFSLIGLGIITILNIAVGAALYTFLPAGLVKIASAAVFILCGIHTLLSSRKTGEVKEKAENVKEIKALLLLPLMELGDKTQIAVITLAASTGHYAEVAIGSLLAFTCTTALSVLLSNLVSKVSRRHVAVLSGVLFIAAGILLAFDLLI